MCIDGICHAFKYVSRITKKKKRASILKNTLKTKTTVNFLICKYIRNNLSLL